MGSFLQFSAAATEPDTILPVVFTTRDFPASSQFDAWREFMSPAIDLHRPVGAEAGFDAEHAIWDLGRFALTRAVLPSYGPPRQWEHVRRNPLDHWCLVLVRDADGAAGTDPRSPGRLFVRSLGTPFLGSACDSEVISLYVPRDAGGRNSARFERLPHDLGRSALHDLLADFIGSLMGRLSDTRTDELPYLVQAIEAMLSACLVPTGDDGIEVRSVLSLSLVERARRIIQREIFSPELTPEYLSRAVGISRSGLYRLFEPFGGVRHTIQRERLLAAHAALTDPESRDPILAVAERSGFGDASGFSRAFRKEFGVTPSEVKAAAALGAMSTGLAPSIPADGSDLGKVLGRLHS